MTSAELERAVDEAWPRAQARWSSYLLLSRPALGKSRSIAQIDLATRQITLDGETIVEKGLTGLVEALLAHEIGHHVRYPGSLAVSARMRIIEKNLVPIEGYSLMNLFTDLMINERLGHDLEDDLVRIYQSFDGERRWEKDPAFVFYLAVYEELWQRERGELQGSAFEPFAKAYPDHRADAQLLAQEMFRLGPNVYTQFLYFASIMSRYLAPKIGDQPESGDPYACGCGEPTPDDWADALTPGAAEKEAIRRAMEEGWFGEDQKERLEGLADLERRIIGLPGSHTDDASEVPEVMAAYYRLEAERYLLRPPPVALLGEAVVPTTLDEWEAGDPVAAIDWLATLVERGDRVGAVQPLKRERIADVEGADVPLWQPRTEIYLDVSGSMPDPRCSRNAMTLAAQILCVGTVRAGGWVRALLYSGDHVKYWTFCRSEVEMSRFLMHYIGGGTVFPFDVLRASVAEHGAGQPIRVVITDTDFDANLDADKENAMILALAASLPARLVLLLHGPRPERVKRYRGMGALVIAVENLDDFPRMAADLSRALFQERVHEAPRSPPRPLRPRGPARRGARRRGHRRGLRARRSPPPAPPEARRSCSSTRCSTSSPGSWTRSRATGPTPRSCARGSPTRAATSISRPSTPPRSTPSPASSTRVGGGGSGCSWPRRATMRSARRCPRLRRRRAPARSCATASWASPRAPRCSRSICSSRARSAWRSSRGAGSRRSAQAWRVSPRRSRSRRSRGSTTPGCWPRSTAPSSPPRSASRT